MKVIGATIVAAIALYLIDHELYDGVHVQVVEKFLRHTASSLGIPV